MKTLLFVFILRDWPSPLTAWAKDITLVTMGCYYIWHFFTK